MLLLTLLLLFLTLSEAFFYFIKFLFFFPLVHFAYFVDDDAPKFGDGVILGRLAYDI